MTGDRDDDVFVLLPDGFSLTAPPLPRAAAPAFAPPIRPVLAPSPTRVPAPGPRPRVARPLPAQPPTSRPSRVAPAAPATVQRRETVLPLALGLFVACALGAVVAWGWGYYVLPLELRPLHAKHTLLRSSGPVGLTLGIVGTVLMLLNLGYLLRKSIPWLARVGSLRRWMGFHVLTGLLGPAMILLHSGWLPTSVLGGFGFGSMLVVVTTGVVGRYIYSRVPRSMTGRELELDEVRRCLGEIQAQLALFGVDARRLAGTAVAAPRGLPRALLAILVGDRELRRQWRRHRDAVLGSPRLSGHAHQVLPLLRRVLREGQWLVRYHELRSLMGSWRFLHRWLAISMLLFAAFHIWVAFRYGDLWVMQ